MAYTFEELKKKTVYELREIAAGIEHEAVQGHTQMNKEHLLVALCSALNINTHGHHEAVGLNKSLLKAQIRDLKKKRAEALEAHDKAQSRDIRRKVHRLKRKIRKATV
ncbi:MAG: hypothetical protein HYY20_12330 [Candidatus Tectomicrobia bacterium]|uniref:Rho termination factor N-terminal domain-containing protein n=1 Tax=Tectimicrobiota bacterium TaxID=2528274 RepID=A0A932CQJ9_UNCTE|nr:hypothetical protein [Candidatus Tectomicrobia bacterium]